MSNVKKPPGFFDAASVIIGSCPNPKCRGVHIHLVDENDVPHAQAVFDCENIESLIADLRATRDRIVMGGASKGLGN